MVKTHMTGQRTDNALVQKALDTIRQIDKEANAKKSEQLVSLREALAAIETRIEELKHQGEQVKDAIARITGKAIPTRKPRGAHDELRGRVLRWLSAHAGEWYTASDLGREFAELEAFPSIAAFLKQAIADGAVKIDKSGGNRNTKYSAARG